MKHSSNLSQTSFLCSDVSTLLKCNDKTHSLFLHSTWWCGLWYDVWFSISEAKRRKIEGSSGGIKVSMWKVCYHMEMTRREEDITIGVTYRPILDPHQVSWPQPLASTLSSSWTGNGEMTEPLRSVPQKRPRDWHHRSTDLALSTNHESFLFYHEMNFSCLALSVRCLNVRKVAVHNTTNGFHQVTLTVYTWWKKGHESVYLYYHI